MKLQNYKFELLDPADGSEHNLKIINRSHLVAMSLCNKQHMLPLVFHTLQNIKLLKNSIIKYSW